MPKPELLAPPNGAVLTAPPLLRWSKVRGADYYNVQLLRDGRKVLSAWPTGRGCSSSVAGGSRDASGA